MGRSVAPGRYFRVWAALAAAAAACLVAPIVVAADDDPGADPAADPDLGLNVTTSSTSFGGASVLATSRTVTHWTGQTTNPVDGVTYAYNMVGVDPSTNGSATIGVDIIPVDVTVGGQPFNGSDRVAGVLASPIFTSGNYDKTMFATKANGGRGSGGKLSWGNTGVQLLDATMRTQFDKVGTGYHLYLDTPVVHDPVAVDVPDGQGVTVTSPGMVTFGLVDSKWFQTRIQNQMGRLDYLDPTRLAVFLTSNIVLYTNNDPFSTSTCCIIGAHGAGSATSKTGGSTHGNGDQPVQTFVWSSWLTAGWFSPATAWAKRDIYGLSHEVVEWGVNPFGDNTVQAWFSDLAPQYGCSNVMETGDPVVGIGFAWGTNVYDQNRFTTDHAYHPSDEALLPWFMRSNPQTQASQSGGARYTFMGDLNVFGIFHAAATDCPS